MKLSPFKKNKHGFGLIEVMISGVVIITVIGAGLIIRQRTSSQAAVARHQSVAYMLAQEGIEAVRQIRDTNYLLKRYDSDAGNFVATSWECDLLNKVSFDTPTVEGHTVDVLTCDPGAGVMSTNTGDFSKIGVGNGTLELGNGMKFGSIFTDQQSGNPTTPFSSWSLSAPDSVFDAGPGNMGADSNISGNLSCNGVERVFVREGNGVAEPSLVTAINPNVRMNRRSPGVTTPTSQDNYWTISACNSTPPPQGFMEYRRQVIVSPSNLNGEVPGNMPILWTKAWSDQGGTDPQDHILRVLVRVSWKETSRLNPGGDSQAVLLATYLTDWRPTN